MKFQSMVLLTVLCGLQAGVSFGAEQSVAGSAEKGQAKAAPFRQQFGGRSRLTII